MKARLTVPGGWFAVLFCLLAVPLPAQEAIFVKIDGVPGGATEDGYEGWMRVESFSTGVERLAGKTAPEFSLFTLVHSTDKASPKLMEFCASGKELPAVQIHVFKSFEGHTLLLRYRLERVLVALLQLTGSAGAGPTESFSLKYRFLSWNYSAYDANDRPIGTPGAWWDLVRQEGHAASEPVFKATGSTLPDGSLEMKWLGREQTSYRIMVGDSINGPFTELRQIDVTQSSDQTFTIPKQRSNKFYFIEELPAP